MEGEEIDLGPDVHTPNWSEESEDENDQQSLSREDSGIQVDRTPLEEQDQNRKLGPRVIWKDEPDARSWLEQHVVHQYWTVRSSRFPHSLHLHSNLATVWDQHLYSSDPLYVPDDRVFVTETQVIRETLWLLSGVKKLFIFQLIDGKVTVRNNIIVTHLTHSCLQSVLEQIAAYGQKTKLIKFCLIPIQETFCLLDFTNAIQNINPLFYVKPSQKERLKFKILLNPCRNKNVPVNHRDFWYATYTLYSVSEKTENEEKMSDNASASSGSDQGLSSRQHTMVSFLKPVLKQIIMAGKSMQLLKNLQCAESTTRQATARDAERKSLYTLFLESVQSRLRHGEAFTAQALTEHQATRETLIKMQSIAERHLELDDVHDPLLAINFASKMKAKTLVVFLLSFSFIDLTQDRRAITLGPFSCGFLKTDISSSSLSISFENVDTAKKKLPVHILDGLTLSYKVPWPVDIVISLECQKIYNQVFLLLLQIKWAKYSLDVLLFGELANPADKSQLKEGLLGDPDTAAHFGPQKEPVRLQIHRMFLLRVKLMHFVNSLHNYIMTRILHSTGLEFQHQVEEAKDLDQLIKIHYRYLSTIHDRCLLREKVSFVKEAIMKVLNLALMFAEGWQAGLGAWQMESIEKMESDFKNCHMFLVTILNKAVCRGSFPHCEYYVKTLLLLYFLVTRSVTVVLLVSWRFRIFHYFKPGKSLSSGCPMESLALSLMAGMEQS
ncbi:TUBGCP5 [Cervus elaphus hippelaphus]|uniref:Gamma-tubulin complex component n=1 Tax=Cervus elaphus hippelaphus TaxID=46360 RepID=A0A212C294_CEREH|nr:TUBGCP5 [Cervus elaphus hippelaphus]